MQFMLKTGREEVHKRTTNVEVMVFETDSLMARTNKRKLRNKLIQMFHIHPTMVKSIMKELGWWKPEDAGITTHAERERLRKLDLNC